MSVMGERQVTGWDEGIFQAKKDRLPLDSTTLCTRKNYFYGEIYCTMPLMRGVGLRHGPFGRFSPKPRDPKTHF